MKTPVLVLLVLLSSCSALAPAPGDNLNAATKANRVSLYAGKRRLAADEWDPIDDQPTLGVEYSRQAGYIGWEVGVMASREEDNAGGIDLQGTTQEAYGGVRFSAGDNVVRPYAGAGVAYVDAKLDPNAGSSADDASFAGYVHGGVTIDLSQQMFIGFDARFLFASSLELYGVDTNADYGQLAIVVGFAF